MKHQMVADEWNLGYITPVQKGEGKKCSDYRGITFSSSVCRLYGRILKGRLEKRV